MQSETVTAAPCGTKQTKFIDPSMHNDIEGVPMCRNSFKVDAMRSGLAYEARPGDIFIVTMPRSGTTWMETIVYSILQQGRPFNDSFDDFSARTPFLEQHGGQVIEKMRRPGSIKTHFPLRIIPQHPQAKYIYVVRNPKDMCTSFYRFLKTMPGTTHSDVPFDTYFDLFIDGRANYGDYFDHVLEAWSRKDESNVLFLVYEDMKKDIRSAIHRVAAFLDVELSEELVERIAFVTSFDYMKNAKYNEHLSEKSDGHLFQPRTVVRKGEIGDWRTLMSEEQSHRLDARFKEATHGIQGLNTLWDDYNVFDNK
ncbi:unnamed protein product [Adineta steineri]|uniref:Sulfotransferase domain-containing protein n=1 Tax=Adineta steineri TaxID=433720 RepID=A0A819GVB2_9BILA|nr:unnamed protein product [Adineta steineri]CAF1475150.1 unnamed protein product [Adineta steineri]CAF3657134.1 unnamed protein product [Adineta steineri]CAF3885667.1 unnamed protein product [Adineta steineri]